MPAYRHVRHAAQVLPSVYAFIGKSLAARPSDLGMLVLCRALVQALSSPFSGMLGDVRNRRTIIGAGCLWWGLVTCCIAVISDGRAGYYQAMALWALNGRGLAAVIPSSQSLLADYFAGGRGQAFGWMYLTGAVGGMLGGFYGTNIGGKEFASPWLPLPGHG